MKEYEVRKQIMKSDLTASEKLVLLAIILKVDWTTLEGKVSAKDISQLISTGERSIKRTLSKLTKIGVLNRSSKRIGPEANESALTKINVSSLPLPSVKVDTSDKIDTSVKVDTTPSVKVDTTPSVKVDTTPSDNIDTTPSVNIDTRINNSNNSNQYTINNNTRGKWGGWGAVREEDKEEEKETSLQGKKVYSFTYQSSIKDPEERLRVENHVKKNYHRLTRSDRDRLLNPDFTKPLIKANR